MHRILTIALIGSLAQNMFGGMPIDGIRCEAAEGSAEHIHANLQLYDRGRSVAVPASIGIPPDGDCLYWLHTHAPDGMMHIESPIVQGFTLGQFFDIWGVPLTRTRAASVSAARGSVLRITVNGQPWRNDPRRIRLFDHEVVVIQAGPPFVRRRRVDWKRM